MAAGRGGCRMVHPKTSRRAVTAETCPTEQRIREGLRQESARTIFDSKQTPKQPVYRGRREETRWGKGTAPNKLTIGPEVLKREKSEE